MIHVVLYFVLVVENALELRQSTESSLSLLLTKVGSMFKVLFNLTTRGKGSYTSSIKLAKSRVQ